MYQFFLQNTWCLILLLIWTIPWKGVALWKSARASHKWWFIALLVINTLAILDILYIFVFSKIKKIEKPIEQQNLLLNDKISSIFQKFKRTTGSCPFFCIYFTKVLLLGDARGICVMEISEKQAYFSLLGEFPGGNSQWRERKIPFSRFSMCVGFLVFLWRNGG